MTNAEYTAARSAVLAGDDPPPELMDDCQAVVKLLVRTAGLPVHYSPYGVWSDEAIEEVYADWVATRLVGRGQLLGMLQRAPVLRVFRRMAETSVRQHLVDGLKRSQSANLYDRVARLLAHDDRFTSSGTGGGQLWSAQGGPSEPFPDDDRHLLGVAWSLGEFQVIRYDVEARKLSPLLEGGDLDRFVTGMLDSGAMTAATLVRALRLRFAVDETGPDTPLDASIAAAEPPSEVLLEHLVTATLAELSERQARVLMGVDSGRSGRELAAQVGCSTGTVSHERTRIDDILARLGTDAPDVLKRVLDSLFTENT